VVVGAGLVGVLAVLTLSTSASATKGDPDHKVTICHRTNSTSNPYRAITVDIASILQKGHGSHEGPVFDASLPEHTRWGDIIPAFDFGPDKQYAGMNLTAEGEAVLAAGCAAGTTTTEPPTTEPPTTEPPTQ
jgi:hypothetical protein